MTDGPHKFHRGSRPISLDCTGLLRKCTDTDLPHVCWSVLLTGSGGVMGVVLGIIIMFFQRRENGGTSTEGRDLSAANLVFGGFRRSVRGEFGVRIWWNSNFARNVKLSVSGVE